MLPLNLEQHETLPDEDAEETEELTTDPSDALELEPVTDLPPESTETPTEASTQVLTEPSTEALIQETTDPSVPAQVPSTETAGTLPETEPDAITELIDADSTTESHVKEPVAQADSRDELFTFNQLGMDFEYGQRLTGIQPAISKDQSKAKESQSAQAKAHKNRKWNRRIKKSSSLSSSSSSSSSSEEAEAEAEAAESLEV